MIETCEEISRVISGTGVIVVQRKLYVPKNIYGLCGIPEEELIQERIENNGRTLTELHILLRKNLNISPEQEETEQTLPIAEQVELKIRRLQIASDLIFKNPHVIKSTILSGLYMEIEDWIFFCEDMLKETNQPIICDYMQLLNDIKKKLEDFYLGNPHRMLELSDDLSQRILTLEACMTPPFLPYITRKLETPLWMVPRTVRTLNDACRVYQTREFMEKEGTDLFLLIACINKSIPLVVWKTIAHYAIDMSKLHFRWFEVVTEEMLRNRYEYLQHVQLDMFSRLPTLILTV